LGGPLPAISRYLQSTALEQPGTGGALAAPGPGAASDGGAVVDARGAVHGLDGPWVVDASIMLAERCAQALGAAR